MLRRREILSAAKNDNGGSVIMTTLRDVILSAAKNLSDGYTIVWEPVAFVTSVCCHCSPCLKSSE